LQNSNIWGISADNYSERGKAPGTSMSIISKIEAQNLKLPPSWMSRVTSRGGAMRNANEIKKILGEPIPKLADPKKVPPKVMAMFQSGGLLERLRKKLARIAKRKGGKIIPAHNTIASVDEEDNLYVGVEFLEQFGEDEELIAGILAHEWGHMKSDLPKGVDWSHLKWDQLHAMRREEEASADGFAGRALFLMGYTPKAMMKFLKMLDKEAKKKKENEKMPSHKYHNTATRLEILKEAWKAQKKANDDAKRIFRQNQETTGAKVGRVFGDG